MIGNNQVVTFETDGALYAVPVDRVQEILDMRETAIMPNAPDHLLGIIDLRGENIPVVDLRCILGLDIAANTPFTRIIVCRISQSSSEIVVGLRTDRVIEVTSLDDGTVKPLEKMEIVSWRAASIVGIGRHEGRIVSVLDVDMLFPPIPGSINVASVSQND